MHDLLAELADIKDQLSQAASLLQNLNDIHIGTTPKTAVYQQDEMTLYHYHSSKPRSIPLLIVFALVNRPTILDLNTECSIIQDLLDAGQDVYLLDWGFPTLANNSRDFTTYINNYLKNCVTFIIKNSGLKKINLLGVCQGGVMSLCYGCIYPQHINALIPVVTPVDFHTTDNTISQLVKNINIDKLVNANKIIPGSWLQQSFISLNPFRLIGKKYLDLLNILNDPLAVKRFLSVEKWLYDTPDLTAAAFKEFLRNFYQQNKLIKGEIKLGKRKVNLSNIKLPLLNIVAKHDHIIPPSASFALQDYVHPRLYSCKIFNSGHIGIFVSDKIRKQLSASIVSWLKITSPLVGEVKTYRKKHARLIV